MKRPRSAAMIQGASSIREHRERTSCDRGTGAARELVMPTAWILALAGGALIGVASALLLVSHGRIAGISGIVGSLVSPPISAQHGWRIAFVAGLGLTGLVAGLVAPSAIGASPRGLGFVLVAGLLVGFGTRLGGGCTSGHGVCGVARMSWRSIVAVLTFMLAGAATTLLLGGAS
jgi:uncharacterized membrane protein YedE/YeeE